MPAYVNSAFQVPVLVMRGVPTYLFGSHNFRQGDTQMLVSKVVGDGTTATLTVQITGGEIPTVGSLISVKQTQTSSGAFNVNRSALTAVSITAATGAGTVSFLSATTVASTADIGSATVEVPEVPETLAAGASIPCCVTSPDCAGQFTVPMAVTFTTALPTAVTVTLQKAIHDNASEYTNTTSAVVVAATAYTAGPVVEATLERGYYYRALVSALTLGSNAGVVVKIGG